MEDYIAQALSGDHAAFARLYDAYAPRALRLATAATGRADLAADAVQEAFLRVYRKGRQCKEDFEPWFYRIVLNESRRCVGRNPFPAEQAERSAPSFSERSDLALTLEAALGKLSPEHRTVLTLKFLLGHTEQEAAAILGVPQGTVKSRLHYAKKELERILGREEASL